MNTTATKTTTNETVNSVAGIDALTKGSVAIMGAASAVIGIWAISCLASAAAVAGPLGLVKGFISAVTGV
ncbi:MAG: hypothetical protein OEY01_01235 [Desulfobulbaceae bacterium]|nr:hypothetical protein [Desulfobulbaceae bacterium]HIJ77915.1 hypothetical protein [Deltaproteobacteria bacterium]